MAIRNSLLAITALLLVGCGLGSSGEPQLTVFAASSLTDAYEELADAFEAQHPGIDILLNFGGSSTLTTQLIEGAPADVFASANQAQMQTVAEAGLLAGPHINFASNRLTIIVPTDNPASIQTPTDLALPGVKLVLAAPGVPVREYSNQAIANLGNAAFQAALYANLVSEEENVRIVVAKVALGEADAGIVYTSDVGPAVAAELRQIAVPDEANVIAAYPIAVLADAPQPDLAQSFVDFVLSAEGQAILQSWGFAPAPVKNSNGQ
jgi:molybdate transport system substrate-binding protein